MKEYLNPEVKNAYNSDLTYHELIDEVLKCLSINYPSVISGRLRIIADLMVCYDEDVIENEEGYFYTKTQYEEEAEAAYFRNYPELNP